jgi:hypothetical protein
MDIIVGNRSYRLPVNLVSLFKKWAGKGKNVSPKVAGAMVFYMLLKTDICEAAEIAAYSEDLELAIKSLQDNLPVEILKIPPEDKELYGSRDKYLSPAKKEFRREVLKILRDSGLLSESSLKTKKVQG